MGEEEYIYAEKLSDDEKEILRLSRQLRRMGKDPVKILNLLVETGDKLDKSFSIGKFVSGYFKRQWELSKHEFKKAKDGTDDGDGPGSEGR
jgi:hypothetical protein